MSYADDRRLARQRDQARRGASNIRCVESTQSNPFTYVVPNKSVLENSLRNQYPVGTSVEEMWQFKDRVPNEGDTARTLEDIDSKYYIRIDGQWVNILGVCDSSEANTQPIYGHTSRPGIGNCLASSDHRHGIPDSFTYWDTTWEIQADGTKVDIGRFREYPEATFAFIEHKGYIRCNQEWVCFTHIV